METNFLFKLCEECAQAMASQFEEEDTGRSIISKEQRKEQYLLQIEQLVIDQMREAREGLLILIKTLKPLIKTDPAHFPPSLLGEIKKIVHKSASPDEMAKENFSLVEFYGLSEEALEAFYRVADVCFKKREYEKTATLLRYLCTLTVDRPIFWTALGNAEYHAQNFEKALQAYAMSCVLQPLDPRPQLYAAHCWEALGEKISARETAEAALKAAEENPAFTEIKTAAEAFLEQLGE